MTDTTAIVWDDAFATRAARMGASEIRELLKVLEQPGILSFAGGIPDPKLFPAAAVQAAAAAILADPVQGAQALQYGPSEGYRPLREWIAAHMAALGVPCGIENIVVTGGSQQGLDFLGKLLLSRGDTMLVTAPTYLGALQAFNAYEPRYDRLDLDGNMTPAGYAEAAAGGAYRRRLHGAGFRQPHRRVVARSGAVGVAGPGRRPGRATDRGRGLLGVALRG